MTATRKSTRRSPSKLPHAVPAEGLRDAIAGLLAQHSHTVPELAQALGYSDGAIRLRLQVLEQRNQAYRVGVSGVAGTKTYTWHAGVQPPAGRESEVEHIGPGELPKRFFTRTYPPINRRDPLVSALFGAPGEH